MQKPTPYTSVLIDPASDIQIHHWAKDMQVEPHELRAAVRLVGPRLGDIRQYFGKSADIIVLSARRNSKTGNPLPAWSAFPSVLGTTPHPS
jgi:Protein of unknown function (DUF3606)